MSLESLRFMLGGAIRRSERKEEVVIRHNEEVVCKEGGIVPFPVDHITDYKFDGTKLGVPTAKYDHPIRLINLTKGTRTQIVVETADGADIPFTESVIQFYNPSLIDVEGNKQATERGDHIRIFWDEVLEGKEGEKESAVEITISPNTYPGAYKVVGDTFIRNENGADEAFQFVINKAERTLAA